MYDTSNEKVRAKFVFCYRGHCEMVSYKNNLSVTGLEPATPTKQNFA